MCSCGGSKSHGFESSEIMVLRDTCEELASKHISLEMLCFLICEASEKHSAEPDAVKAFKSLTDLERLVLGLRYSEFLIPQGYSEDVVDTMRATLQKEFLNMLGFEFSDLMIVLPALGLN